MATLDPKNDVPEKERTRKLSPLRATMTLQAMHRTSPLRLRNLISPTTELSPGLDLSSFISGKGMFDGRMKMRRTASLDAICTKGIRNESPQQSFSRIGRDKSTQTPSDWSPCCLADVMSPSCCCQETSTPRRGSAPPSPWPNGTGMVGGDNIEKLIRQRLQRSKQEMSSGILGSRFSPVPADHSLIAPTSTVFKPYACIQANICHSEFPFHSNPLVTSPHQRPAPHQRHSSVEELNQEIENLVLCHRGPPETNAHTCISPQQCDGRTAPLPDYFHMTRSVDTQTPALGSSPSSSPSPTLSPSLGDTLLTPPHSPGQTQRPRPIVSPHINKFLTREPPDGCERIALKIKEDKSQSPGPTWSTNPPPNAFTLLPSLGSAFYTPSCRDRGSSLETLKNNENTDLNTNNKELTCNIGNDLGKSCIHDRKKGSASPDVAKSKSRHQSFSRSESGRQKKGSLSPGNRVMRARSLSNGSSMDRGVEGIAGSSCVFSEQ